nr:immunoglobulin light chain junction region [Macaca mulatta]
CLQYNSSPYRF